MLKPFNFRMNSCLTHGTISSTSRTKPHSMANVSTRSPVATFSMIRDGEFVKLKSKFNYNSPKKGATKWFGTGQARMAVAIPPSIVMDGDRRAPLIRVMLRIWGKHLNKKMLESNHFIFSTGLMNMKEVKCSEPLAVLCVENVARGH